MNKKPNIPGSQLIFMTVGSALVFPYTFMPILSTPPANQDVWIVLFIAIVYIVIINTPTLFLINKLRGININDALEIVLGKFFGIAAAVLFALFFIYCLTACALITEAFINIFIFRDTPAWAILLYIFVPVSYAAYKGPDLIGRLSAFIVPIVFATIVIFFVGGIGKMDLSVIQPILADSTFLELNAGAFLTGARYSEILIFLVFSFFLSKKASINKTYVKALSIFAIFFFLILMPTVLTLGVEFGKHAWNPYYTYTRQIQGFDFIQRVHSLNLLAWFPAVLLKLMLYNFMGSYVLKGIFRTKSHKGFVIPLCVVAFCVCLIPALSKSSTIEVLRSDGVFPFIVLPVTLVLPLIITAVYLIRKDKIIGMIDKKKREQEAMDNAQPAN